VYRRYIAMRQGVRAQKHRINWPETNVGASTDRDAPCGRRSVSQTLQTLRRKALCPANEHPKNRHVFSM
ncbi:hypothetical protein LD001_26705, partial [Pseudomonas kurunegalensis]|uniref:hypothetical protein n=1 Tax=Pseudomonas kurunegalensis TaxID=485880 RepID=UPI001CDD5827